MKTEEISYVNADAQDLRFDVAVSDGARSAAERILAAHRSTFDLQSPYRYHGRDFFGFGEYHAEASSYVLSKRAKLWELNAHEYLFVLAVPFLDAAALADAVEFMKTDGLSLVNPGKDHMTTYLSLAIVADAVEEGLAKTVRRTRFRKNFKAGWNGWADLRLAVADLSRGEVASNGQGKPLAQTMEVNLK